VTGVQTCALPIYYSAYPQLVVAVNIPFLRLFCQVNSKSNGTWAIRNVDIFAN